MPADHLPAFIVLYPHVGEKHAVLDLATEIFDAPLRLDRADHHLIEDDGVTDVEIDGYQLALLDGVEPFVARENERAGRTGSDEHEARMNQGSKAVDVLCAKRVAPFTLESANQLATIVHAAIRRRFR